LVVEPSSLPEKVPKNREKPYFGTFTIVKQINDVNYLVRKGPSVPAFITHVDKLNKYVCDVPDARVSVICRKMRHRYYCPSCEYETSNRRSIRRHAIGHHNLEWWGLGRPLCPIPSERHAAITGDTETPADEQSSTKEGGG